MKSPFSLAAFAGVLLSLPLGLVALAQAQVHGPITAPRLPPLLIVRDAAKPIELESARVDGEVAGGLARTSIELVFRNPNARVLEGELQFPLRDGQQVAGFALDIDGALRPAVPVPKAKGRQVFETIERRSVDPALLEQTAGNQFKLRIYPIPAQGTRRVRLELSESLSRHDGEWKYELPLAFAAQARHFDLAIRAAQKPKVEGLASGVQIGSRGGRYTVSLNQPPVGNALSLSIPASATARAYTQDVAGERYFLAEVPVEGARQARALPKSIGLLWDSSASGRKRDNASELALLDRYFRAAGTVQVSLIRLRDRAEPARNFAVSGGDWSALRRELQSTVYDGATDPGGWEAQAGIEEYLVVSDGLFNYGKRSFPKLLPRQRLFALNSAGASGDGARLSALAQANGGRLISWQRAGELDRAADALLNEGPQLLGVSALGASEVVADSPFADGGLLRIAGRLSDAKAQLTLRLRDGRGEREQSVAVDAGSDASGFPAGLWARYSIAALQADADLNRAAIARLGQRFGIVTAETSLIVLDDIADYVRYDIAPPDRLDEFNRLKTRQAAELDGARKANLDRVAEMYQQRLDWWQRDWPKNAPPKPADELKLSLARQSGEERSQHAYAMAMAPPPPPPPAPMAEAEAAPIAADATTLDSVEIAGGMVADAAASEAKGAPGSNAGARARINLQPWQPDSPYARRLRQASADQVYAIYLDERDSNAGSTAFYLDVADVLSEKGERDLALRVLSNLAEMDLENRHILRVLGYRLMQAGQPALAVPVLQQVLRLAEEEPQSFRDLGLAYAANGQYQQAVDSLYEVALRDWDQRFPGIEEIALAELNAIAAAHPGQVDTRRIDPRLSRNLPLDLRVVLSWDSDNSDMDLWVTDPNGEKCFYSHKLTYQGGRITNDFTGGYGPEEFSLRKAKPGKYKVEANFYGDRQQLVTGATTLSLWLSTGFGGQRQNDQRVTLRLKDQKEVVLVGEFEVK
ncbi:VIT domain-containing protein [Lysobacter capsici]|uniref:VIT domain-containing protein n=1 Tax=Lysobacter capsici TaxID=435897 RepID=UPI00287BBA64|nr:VIT domain-containing protein [Lysobacter capsici]WND82880.1 VIT domain-containing protein [Lysobacter capsici]WND88078.1 VIT domain-containing protein [Lysobacter capsici]